MEALVVYRRHRDGVDAIGIAVKIALIAGQSAIATGKYEYGASAVSTILYAVNQGLVNDVAWSLHRFAVVWGSPTARINVDMMKTIVERRSFVDVRDGTGENAHACHLCFIGEADTADVVLGSCDLTGTASAMAIIGKDGFGERSVIVEVIGMLGVLGGMRNKRNV